MQQYINEVITYKKCISIDCDRCKKSYDPDSLEVNNFISYCGAQGYGSKIGDGKIIGIDLCEECVVQVLGPWLRIDEND
jgi:hypothetical protein